MDLECAYLQHIKLFLSSEDSDNFLFRVLVDRWFAHHAGPPFLNRNGRVIWFNNPHPVRHAVSLGRMHFMSDDADRVINAAGAGEWSTNDRLVADHAIPVSVLLDKLRRQRVFDMQSIETILKNFYRLGVITKNEDRLLNAAGLRRRMPDNWDENDVYARYKTVGIRKTR